MSNWEFNTLRLPIYVPVDQSLATQVIALAHSNGMKVIIDLHNDQAKYWSARYFGSQAWIDFWKTQATKWKGNPDIVAFELFNEPWFTGTWDPTYVHDERDIYVRYKACTDAIRQIDPSRTVIWGDPHCSNVLPLDAGFNGWYGHVLEKYLAYKSNVVFSFHMYPAPFRCYDRVRHTTPWQEVTAAMQYVQSLGFKVWLGEFSAEDLNTGRLASNGLSFVTYCINWCVANNSGFSLWEYRNDHGCPLGTYDRTLAQSNYALYV